MLQLQHLSTSKELFMASRLSTLFLDPWQYQINQLIAIFASLRRKKT